MLSIVFCRFYSVFSLFRDVQRTRESEGEHARARTEYNRIGNVCLWVTCVWLAVCWICEVWIYNRSIGNRHMKSHSHRHFIETGIYTRMYEYMKWQHLLPTLAFVLQRTNVERVLSALWALNMQRLYSAENISFSLRLRCLPFASRVHIYTGLTHIRSHPWQEKFFTESSMVWAKPKEIKQRRMNTNTLKKNIMHIRLAVGQIALVMIWLQNYYSGGQFMSISTFLFRSKSLLWLIIGDLNCFLIGRITLFMWKRKENHFLFLVAKAFRAHMIIIYPRVLCASI